MASSLTSHNNIFGWVNGFTITDNSIITGRARYTDTPYPPIISNATVTHCLKSWNMADTGMMLFATLGGMLISIPIASRASHSIFGKRAAFFRLTLSSITFGFFLGLRNSWYRLQGLVPNGLEDREQDPQTRIKFDYTSDFLSNSFLGFLIDPPKNKEEKQ